MAKDMLFATLDPTMRAVNLPDGTEVILSDTVGFISDLPTQLVAAFRATLEEVLDADLICHVRDISHPQTVEQAEDVRRILEDLGVAETVPQLEVWNKIDLLPGPELETRRPRPRGATPFTRSRPSRARGWRRFLVRHRRAGVRAAPSHVLTLPHSDGRRRAWLFERGVVEAEDSGGEETRLTVRWTDRQAQAFRALGDDGLRPPFITRSPMASSAKPKSVGPPSRSSSTSAPRTIAAGGIRSVTISALPDPAAATTGSRAGRPPPSRGSRNRRSRRR
jgi:GTP-binding protein HflX